MTEEVKKALTPEESKQTGEIAKSEAETKEEVKAEVKAETKTEPEVKEEKVGDILNPKEDIEKKEQRLVPEAVLLEYKNQNKELKGDIAELKKLIEAGATKKEISQDLEQIAEEHNIDKDFLAKLVKSIKASVETDVSTKLKPLEDKERQDKISKIFEDHYAKTIEGMAEYKDIADKEVIKQLSFLPQNANKTFAQIIEATYGKLITGKRTLESVKAGKKEVIGEIDFARAKREPEYFKEVMANPELKKKYNDNLLKTIAL
jgi:hypothetical protein